MGLYDSVWIPCPRCGHEVEFQSKAGRCEMAEYTLATVPPSIAGDVSDDVSQCECGASVKILAQVVLTPVVVQPEYSAD